MKRKLIALTAFLAVLLTGCGQMDEMASSETNHDTKSPAAQIEVQTEGLTETAATLETTSIEKQTATEEKSTTMNVTEPTSEKTAATEDNTELPTLNFEADEQDIPQETIIQVTRASEDVDTPTTSVEIVPSEIVTEAPTQANIDTSDIFKMLNSLHYEPVTCDGIPERTFIDDDGTAYQVNFTERWVWRNGIEEAYLPDELYSALYYSEPISLQ